MLEVHLAYQYNVVITKYLGTKIAESLVVCDDNVLLESKNISF